MKQGIGGTDESLEGLLEAVGWTGAELRRRVECSPATVYKWLHGECRVPGSVKAYLKLIIKIRATVNHLGVLDG